MPEPMADSPLAERLIEAVRLIDATPVRWPRGEWRLESWDDGAGTIMVCRDRQGRMLAAMNPDDYETLRAKLCAD